MSLKDLLPEGTYDEILDELGDRHEEFDPSAAQKPGENRGNVLYVKCPRCGKQVEYSAQNPFRPFCSERCKMIDLGAWANEDMVIKGKKVDEDEDSEALEDPHLPKRFESQKI